MGAVIVVNYLGFINHMFARGQVASKKKKEGEKKTFSRTD